MEPINTAMVNVERLLMAFEESRADDKVLTALYWQHVDKLTNGTNFYIDYVTRGTTPETITRCRRLIQADGRWLPPTCVEIARRQREAAIRESISDIQNTKRGL